MVLGQIFCVRLRLFIEEKDQKLGYRCCSSKRHRFITTQNLSVKLKIFVFCHVPFLPLWFGVKNFFIQLLRVIFHLVFVKRWLYSLCHVPFL